MFEIGTGSLLSSTELIDGKIPRISAKSDNNGILGYYDTLANSNARHFENFITVNFFGTDGGIFYHPYKASIEMKVHTLKIPNHNFNRYTGAFIAGALKQNLKGFDYGSQLSSSKLKKLDLKIQLPTKNGKLDFDFMERFVAEIEKERVLNLENYLNEIGISDYHLTEQENQTLENFESGKIKLKEYKLDDLFTINTYKKRFDANKVNITDKGEPYVVRTSVNNGVRGYIDEDKQFLNEGNTISFGQDTATVYYQEQPYFTGDKIKIVKAKDSFFNRKNAFYFIASMTKSFSSFSWGSSSFSVKIIKEQPIQIPLKENKPDYETMETIISAIHKLVIKDVVLYVERKKKELNKLTENANA